MSSKGLVVEENESRHAMFLVNRQILFCAVVMPPAHPQKHLAGTLPKVAEAPAARIGLVTACCFSIS